VAPPGNTPAARTWAASSSSWAGSPPPLRRSRRVAAGISGPGRRCRGPGSWSGSPTVP